MKKREGLPAAPRPAPPPPLRPTERLDPSIFQLPVEKMREGYYSDQYFTRAREILLADGENPKWRHLPQQILQVRGRRERRCGEEPDGDKQKKADEGGPHSAAEDG